MASVRADGSDPVPTAADLADGLFSTARELRRQAVQALLDEEVTYERMRLLTFLRDDGDLTMTDVSRRLGVTPRAVTNYAQCMHDGGLLERRPHSTDRRATLLHLTDRGREVIDRLWDAHREQMAAVVDHLSDEQKLALQDILATLARAGNDPAR